MGTSLTWGPALSNNYIKPMKQQTGQGHRNLKWEPMSNEWTHRQLRSLPHLAYKNKVQVDWKTKGKKTNKQKPYKKTVSIWDDVKSWRQPVAMVAQQCQCADATEL